MYAKLFIFHRLFEILASIRIVLIFCFIFLRLDVFVCTVFFRVRAPLLLVSLYVAQLFVNKLHDCFPFS